MILKVRHTVVKFTVHSLPIFIKLRFRRIENVRESSSSFKSLNHLQMNFMVQQRLREHYLEAKRIQWNQMIGYRNHVIKFHYHDDNLLNKIRWIVRHKVHDWWKTPWMIRFTMHLFIRIAFVLIMYVNKRHFLGIPVTIYVA